VVKQKFGFMRDLTRIRRMQRHEMILALEFHKKNLFSRCGYRWITRLRLKQYLMVLNEGVGRFRKERVLRSVFARWVEARRKKQVLYYTGQIADGRYRISIVRKALVAWKVRWLW
jgi:hypothetical protein